MNVIDPLNRAARRMPARLLYLGGPLPVIWVYYLGLTGGLGIDPAKKIEHQLGEWALWLLIAGLSVTPLRRYVGLNLFKFRRAIGVLGFFYLLAHFLTWMVFDIQFLWGEIGKDIVKRPYITVGFIAFLLLIGPAITSNDLSIRKLGASRWRRLHLLVYPAAILAGLHFVWLVKGFQIEPLIYLGVILALLATRLRWNWQRAAA